jgi:3-methylfumaryl-CoA hydratase
MSLDILPLLAWKGRTETRRQQADPEPLAGLAALLDQDPDRFHPGVPVPPLWHWAYFLPRARQSDIDTDGHPRKGGFLPPVPLPRRMWAGSDLEFHAPLRVGDAIERRSTVADIRMKQGRAGTLVFVEVLHEVHGPQGLALRERQDIVYREPPAPGETPPAGEPAPADPAWQQAVQPTPMLLFRYSALTFNSHRIHYDRPYATEVEGYPGLVVHGPLQATWMMELARAHRPGHVVTRFQFRAARPLFDTTPLRVCGQPELAAPDAPPGGTHAVDLWVCGPDGLPGSRARVETQPGAT